jgi:hypothetical protein
MVELVVCHDQPTRRWQSAPRSRLPAFGAAALASKFCLSNRSGSTTAGAEITASHASTRRCPLTRRRVGNATRWRPASAGKHGTLVTERSSEARDAPRQTGSQTSSGSTASPSMSWTSCGTTKTAGAPSAAATLSSERPGSGRLMSTTAIGASCGRFCVVAATSGSVRSVTIPSVCGRQPRTSSATSPDLSSEVRGGAFGLRSEGAG